MEYKFNFFKKSIYVLDKVYTKLCIINTYVSWKLKRQLSQLNLRKISAINVAFILNWYIFSSDIMRKDVDQKLKCNNKFNYLLPLSSEDISNLTFQKKKCPKILFLEGGYLQAKDSNAIENCFTKIHSKYKDLETYSFDLRKSLNSVNDLEKLLNFYGYSLKNLLKSDIVISDSNLAQIKEELFNKPFIFINKYGDLRNYSLSEFKEISKTDSVFNYFEKLSILNNKHDLLLLGDYDYAFIIYLDGKKIDYSHHIFRIFRKMSWLINFFNIKFYVATPEHSEFLISMYTKDNENIDLNINDVYLIKRDNMLRFNFNDNDKNRDKYKYEFEMENFEVKNITNDIRNLSLESDDDTFTLNLTKILLKKYDFIYYSNHSFKTKQGLEILNLYFKHTPYYLYFTNLKDETNREKLVETVNVFQQNLDNFKENFAFVVVDNERVNKNVMFKLFRDKTFDLKSTTLQNTKFEEKISHYDPSVTKKLRLTEINKDTLFELINKENITFEENFLFKKKIMPDNLKLINHILFDFYIKENDKNAKIILIKNKDEKYNRSSMQRIETLAKNNKNLEFYYMYNTQDNMDYLNKKYGENISKITNYPQLLILNEKKLIRFPNSIFLRYKISEQEILKEFKNRILYLN